MSGGCRHEALLLPGKLSPPTAFSKVFKDECCLCFKTPSNDDGLMVCLTCFQGGCPEHASLHFSKSGHSLALNIKQTLIEDEEPSSPTKILKLEIPAPVEPKYRETSQVYCFSCQEIVESPVLQDVVKQVLAVNSAKKKTEIQSWQETFAACDHTKGLVQDEVSAFAARGHLKQCRECQLTGNLWLCLTCGSVGCGRRQFDGSGGNGHAAEHFKATGHGVSLKLGTISPEGGADIFCYGCDEMRLDPELKKHLLAFDIHVEQAEKSCKSMAELQLEQNLKYDFSMATEDGREFEPAVGELSLKNLGNSCYLASVAQVCFNQESFKRTFNDLGHFSSCTRDPSSCFVCQSIKLQQAFQAPQGPVAPWMFKAVATTGHAEFSSKEQQDAAEFLAYLFKVIQRNSSTPACPVLKPFEFVTQQKLTCTCGKERYKSELGQLLQLELSPCVLKAADPLDPKVSLDDCINLSFASDEVELTCSECQAKSMCKESYLVQTPEVLVLPLSRYVIENWVPRKLDIPVSVPASLDLSSFVRKAHPDTVDAKPVKAHDVDETSLQQLVDMGFSRAKAIRAMEATGNVNADLAMNWLFEHMEDPEPTAEGPLNEPPEEMISLLVAAGFSEAASKAALLACNLDVERAFEYVLSHPEPKASDGAAVPSYVNGSPMYDLVAFISHKGPSIHCGHYVAYRKDQASGKWILCNDDKLAYLPSEDTALQVASAGYIFFYKQR